MKIACIGNAVYDCLAYRNGFIKEDLRNDFSESLFSAGGPALNAASVIAKYGGDVDFYGRIGNDINGKNIIKILKDSNINIDNLKITDNIKTPFSFIIINSLNNTRTICTIKSNQDNNPFINIKPNNNYDFILTDGKYPNDTINLIKHNPNAITIIDAGRVRPGVINLCKIVDYIICSEDFANELTNLTINDDINNNSIIFYQLKNMFKNAKGIVITVGKNGYIWSCLFSCMYASISCTIRQCALHKSSYIKQSSKSRRDINKRHVILKMSQIYMRVI